MAALATLAVTALDKECQSDSPDVLLASTSGLVPGTRLYVDRELMAVVAIGIGKNVKVTRGVDGTSTARHSGGTMVVVGRGDQFYTTDPPPASAYQPAVNPWINILTGKVWVLQGEEEGIDRQWWQEVTVSHERGVLGFPFILLYDGNDDYNLAEADFTAM
jgi:hypothetical protein